ncbi:hypothetical protein GX586_06570 [bacterium]|nr:hypothetical protein [bacterium]
MKQTVQMQELEALMRSSQIVAGGFLGSDTRPLSEIIEADEADVAALGATLDGLGAKMAELTAAGKRGLGTAVAVGDGLSVRVEESRGLLICPWPNHGRFLKTETIVTRLDTGVSIHWSDLSAHLIAAHGFFQGRGSAFRVEPRDLVAMLSLYHPSSEHPSGTS